MSESNELFEKINKSLSLALQGQLPEVIDVESEEHKLLIENLNKLFCEYNESCEFIKNITSGTLGFKASRGNLLIKSYLKTLQMMLNHLTWKTQRVAEGDFTQRINFLGDFSTSYNYMVLMLEENIKQINEQTQQLKKYQEQKLNLILDNMLGGVLIFDQNGIISFCNNYIEQIFQYSTKEIIGNRVESIIPEITADLLKLTQVRFEKQFTNKNLETFFVDVSINSITIQERISYIAVIYDITELKKMQKIKTEFVSTVSHELRTPLTAINGSISLIKAEVLGKLPDKALELLCVADKNGARLLNMINDLLDMEKIENNKLRLELQDQDLISILNEAFKLNAPFANEFKVKLDFQNNIDELKVLVDKSRLIQVITNLISNAVKFSKPDQDVKIMLEKINNYVRVSIIDKGCGIAEENFDKIFQRFTQLDSSDTRSRGGTGLGLYISKIIIESHKGKIGFNSSLNHGSTFYFELPVLLKDNGVISPVNGNSEILQKAQTQEPGQI